MGSYNQEKDKLIKLFEMKKDKGSLLVSIFSYDGGKAKLGFTRSFEKKDGSVGYGQLGRMTLDEIKFLKDNLDTIIDIIDKN
jgi:hypothetical protein